MGFTKEKREQIKRYILEKIEEESRDIAKKVADTFDISLNTVYRYFKELENEKIIIKNGKEFDFVENGFTVVLSREKGEMKEEHVIYSDYIQKYIEELPDNIQRIWEYSFMEMMNNVIDHSQSSEVVIRVSQNYMYTAVMIVDFGVGIFRKIKDFYNYDSLDDAVTELFKGKLTTDSRNHSGEGIFFTSRVLDVFMVLSDGKIFSHDRYDEMLHDLKDIPELKDCDDCGTAVLMQLSNFSKKTIKEVFDMYADVDGGFTKTQIAMRNMFDSYPVSRSQAKRICNRFEDFQEVVIDFKDISEIGQGFAHEIFVVFQNNHPNVKLTPINTNEAVKKMINHVLR